MAARPGNPGWADRRRLTPLERFRSFCRFEPETGCVVWVGAKTMGRGKHIPYGSFWAEGRRWFAHRWAAQHIHSIDIDKLQVDHCCPLLASPNTLCVQHLQAVTLLDNVLLQHERRRQFIHLEVGLLEYEAIYGPMVPDEDERIPFFTPPNWLNHKGPAHDDCPF